MHQDREPCDTLDQRPDRGLVHGSGDEVALPMTGLDTIIDLVRSLLDRRHRHDEPACPLVVRAALPMQSSSTQHNAWTGRKDARNGVQRLIDRLGSEMQVGAIRPFLPQTVRDLLGAPALVETFLNETAQLDVEHDCRRSGLSGFLCKWP
jgi:hypothetical protein